MNFDPSVLGSRLRTARAVRGLSQPDLAARAGLTQSQLSRIESGQTADPSISAVVALARTLKLSLDTLTHPDGDVFNDALSRSLRDPALQLMIGVDKVTGSPVTLTPFDGLSGHMALTGVSGSGKSYLNKLIALRATQIGVPVTTVDLEDHTPARMVDAVGGQTISLSPNTHECLNPLAGLADGEEGVLRAGRLLATLAFGTERPTAAEWEVFTGALRELQRDFGGGQDDVPVLSDLVAHLQRTGAPHTERGQAAAQLAALLRP